VKPLLRGHALSAVIAGLDPAIHEADRQAMTFVSPTTVQLIMDARAFARRRVCRAGLSKDASARRRVKPAHDAEYLAKAV